MALPPTHVWATLHRAYILAIVDEFAKHCMCYQVYLVAMFHYYFSMIKY